MPFYWTGAETRPRTHQVTVRYRDGRTISRMYDARTALATYTLLVDRRDNLGSDEEIEIAPIGAEDGRHD